MSSDYAPPQLSLDVLRKILSREYAKVFSDPSGRPKAAIHVYEELVANGQQELADIMMYFHAVTGAIPPPMPDRPNITYNISGSTIGSATFSSQVGSINSSVNVVAQQPGGIEFADALKALTDAVLKSTDLGESDKREALDALELVGKQAEEPPEKRKSGILKPVLESIPKLLSTASTAISVWHSVAPPILKFFGYA
jgi:hypothetical protein